jgi:hypothetical protein
MENKDKLIAKLEKYIAFLNKANESPIFLASIHGWHCDAEDREKGIKYREEIKLLKDKII